MTKNFISFAKPSITDQEINLVTHAMKSGWLTTGPQTAEFEKRFAESVGAKHALSVNSATAGLHLALEAAGITHGDYVIVPNWTFTATAEAVQYLGATPYFVDVHPKTLNLDIAKLAQAINLIKSSKPKRLKAIIPVHFAGLSCEMDKILKIAQNNDLLVIEDAAHAFPSSSLTCSCSSPAVLVRNIGSISDATVFSFYATKTLATGEGGMICTDNDSWARRIKTMRLHGINRDVWDRYTSNVPSWYYEVVDAGFKYNLTDIASSIGLAQLDRSPEMHSQRSAIASLYHHHFQSSLYIEPPVLPPDNETHSWHLYVIKINTDLIHIDRNNFINLLSQRGIGCSVHFIPMHLQPYWKQLHNLSPSDFPVSHSLFQRVISLPIYPSLGLENAEYIAQSVLEIAQAHSK